MSDRILILSFLVLLTGNAIAADPVPVTVQRLGDLYYRVREICEMTGMSKPKVFQALKQGKLRGIKLDGTLLIPADSLKRYLDDAVPWTDRGGDSGRCVEERH